MKFLLNEKRILNIIKYAPFLFILLFSILITQILIHQQNENLKLEIQNIQKVFLENNKKRAKEETIRVLSMLKYEKENFEKSLKKEIKNHTYEAHKIATNIYEEEIKHNKLDHTHTKEHIFHTIKIALGGNIFNQGRGYYFIIDAGGKILLQPLNPEFEGKNFLNFKDANGYAFANKMVETIKKKSETFDTYFWYKNTDKRNSYKKISFYKYFEPYNIAIGHGEYVDDYEQELKEKLLKRIQNIRYGDDSYLFVYDEIGNCLSHPQTDLIGINRLNAQDINGKYVIQELLNFAQYEKEGFISYNSILNEDEIEENREVKSYVRLFEEWGWIIGTGFYIDKLNQEIEQKKQALEESNDNAIENILLTSLIVTIISLILSFYISRSLSLMFKQYRTDIKNEIQNRVEKEKLLIQQSKMATMGEMLGSIAHQWKQPLSLLSVSNGMIKLSREDKSLFKEKQIDEAVNSIDIAINNISQTIDDFRNFFNPNKERTLFVISDAFKETFKLLTSQFKNNNIEIIQNIDDISLYGSQNELQQTLINLLKNAKEELTKLHSDEKKLIFIDVYEDKNYVVIKIKDNANGIAEDIIHKIFDSYFTTKENDGGSGIGLYMCKQIIEGSMYGQISVKNSSFTYEKKEYKGAQFTISIPLDLRDK